MKIGFVLPTYSRKASGGKKVVYEYANFLASHGHSVSILYPYKNYKGKLKRTCLPNCLKKTIFRYAVSSLKVSWFNLDHNVRKVPMINEKEQNGKFDILIATAIETVDIVDQIDVRKDKVYFIQDYENWQVPDRVVNDSYRNEFRKIVISSWLKKKVDQYSPNPAYLVPDGINTDVFYPYVDVKDKIHHSVVFQWRPSKHKGGVYAFQVIKKLEKKYLDLTVYCISRDEAPSDLPQSCVFIQNATAEQVSEVNNKCQIFMCTSIEEGYGLPGLEAMGCGAACVSTSYSGVMEYAKNGENILLSAPRDVDAMYMNIVSLFEDHDLYNKIRNGGISSAKEHSMQNEAKKFEQIILE